MINPDSHLLKTRLISISLFAIAMGILEASCVVYLREILLPDNGNVELIPLIEKFLSVEIAREAATLVILATVGILAAYNWRTRFSMFFLAFGIWDIFYYIGLKIFLDWPTTIMEWDALFLIPITWYGPVLAPVLISLYFIIVSVIIILREATGKKLHITIPVIILQLTGFIIWYYSFIKDTKQIYEFGYESVSYSWLLFAIGLIFGIAGIYLTFQNKHNKNNNSNNN